VSISRSISRSSTTATGPYFGQEWIGLSTGTARVLKRLAPTKWWGENTLVTFAYRIMLNMNGLPENEHE
jgi:hypothetical protein